MEEMEKLEKVKTPDPKEQSKLFRRTKEFLARLFTPTKIENKSSAQLRILDDVFKQGKGL